MEPQLTGLFLIKKNDSHMNKKVLFRLDSGGKYGLGHLMRSKALADALRKKGVECTFAVKTVHANNALNPHQLLFIGSEAINTEDEFLALAENYDSVIIDHYDYSSELFYALSQLEHTTLVVLDDECNRGFLYADLIINPVNQARSLPYQQMSPGAELLLGSDYILLGQAFAQVACPDYESRDSIVVTFGGSDVTNLTLPVLKAIKNTSLTDFNIIVVTGGGGKNIEEIKDYCHQYDFLHQHNVNNMAALFSKARFALSAAGSTAFELACCGVPAVFAVVADNQLMSINEQCQSGWCEMVDCRRENKAEELVHKAEQMIKSTQLESFSQTAQALTCAQGADRAASYIKETFFSVLKT